MTNATSDAPLFSVIIPTYNRAATMDATLQSCWQQTCTDLEVILVDDGSSDNTGEVAASIKDPRFHYVHQENGGPARARNTGMDMARGRYLAFLDSDDVWLPDHLSNALKAINNDSADYLYTQIIVDRGVGKYWTKPARGILNDENIFDYLYVHGGFIQTSTMVISRALADQVKWDEALTYGDNDQFAIDLWKTGAKPHMLANSQTLYADVLSPDALSQLPIFSGNSAKHTNFLDWMAKQRNEMSTSSTLAFAARFESVSVARTSPFRALSLIWQAWRGNAMSAKSAIRQILLSFTPRLYRRLTDQFVRFRGSPMDLSIPNLQSPNLHGPESQNSDLLPLDQQSRGGPKQ